MLKGLRLVATLSVGISCFQFSVTAQTSEYACYILSPSGQVINLDSLCSGQQQSSSFFESKFVESESQVESLSFSQFELQGSEVIGTITNNSDQSVFLKSIAYNIIYFDGTKERVVLPRLAVGFLSLEPGESATFSDELDTVDKRRLRQYFRHALKIKVVGASVI